LAANADAIVVSNAPDDDWWRALLEAHTDLHRLCRAPGGSRARDQPRLRTPEGGSAVSVDEDQGPRMIVDLVDRLASRHRSDACDPPAPAPPRNDRPEDGGLPVIDAPYRGAGRLGMGSRRASGLCALAGAGSAAQRGTWR